jgi:prefoldin subunit 5
MILGAIIAAVLIVLDDRQSTAQIKTLTELKSSADSAAYHAAGREEDAKKDRTELKQEIVKLRSRIDPFLSLATARYPSIDPEKALERLAQDIKELKQRSEQLDARTQRLAERDFFRPLGSNPRQLVVANLKRVFARFPGPKISVSVSVEIGHSGRQTVAKELVDILQEGGAQVSGPLPVMTFAKGVLPAVIIKMNPADEDVARALAEVLNPFVKTVFSGTKKADIEVGKISVNLHGEPLFDENGVVTFR